MMLLKRFLGPLLVCLSAASCAAETDAFPCIDALTSCEFAAARESYDSLLHWIALRDCSYDYGACVSEPGIECEVACSITYVASLCIDACYVNTSSTGEDGDG